MNPHMTPAEISGFLERTLLRVQKPARYTGGEWNSIAKEWDATVQPGRWTARLSSPKTPAPDASANARAHANPPDDACTWPLAISIRLSPYAK